METKSDGRGMIDPSPANSGALDFRPEWCRVCLARIDGNAVITADTEGRVTVPNPVAESLTGWARGEEAGGGGLGWDGGGAVALVLRAGTMARARACRGQGTLRGAAGAHPAALPAQQHEHDRESDPPAAAGRRTPRAEVVGAGRRRAGHRRKPHADPWGQDEPEPSRREPEHCGEEPRAGPGERGDPERLRTAPALRSGGEHERQPMRRDGRVEKRDPESGNRNGSENGIVHRR